MNTKWKTKRAGYVSDILGPVRFRTDGQKFQRRVVRPMDKQTRPVLLTDYFAQIQGLSNDLEDPSIEKIEGHDGTRTFITGWTDDMDGYTEEDMVNFL